MLRIFSTVLLFAVAPHWGGKADPAPLPSEAALRGVDVSHHQKEIEWQAVLEKEVLDFAFVKATEGGDFVDSLFCDNWESLRQLGIRRGAYHFFRAYGCGDEQALHFLSQVEMFPGDLAPVLDIEVLDGIAPEIMVQEARIWLDMVESRLGIKPIIYSNLHFYERYLAGHFDEYPLWVARYSDEKPRMSSGKMWDFWQFSNEGCVEGISKKVDLNVFPGTYEMLDRLCWYPEKTTGPAASAAAAP
ncbi:MAG: GH25 family lysozyme [Saprospiraceae bacterium]|nr:GH25 family lysozyme [Saprospiraceae bacterium]